ncbi:MAG TPA: family 43 glycosylhydrolase, partial [Acidimicrobiales bacterium]|nr:family 43 glycosylhydrolase [Acidimicrobiales bacterium]
MGEHRPPRRPLVVGLAVGLAVVVVAGLVDDLTTQVRLHHAEVATRAVGAELGSLIGQVADVDRQLTAAASDDRADQTQLAASTAQLASTQRQLQANQESLALQHADLDTVNACVDGLQKAVADLQGGAQATAIADLGAVAAVCQKVQAGTPGGPVYPYDFPDPDVVDVAGTYYGYATNSAGGNIQIIRSTDLASWSTVGDALPSLPSWATPGSTWAPGVIDVSGS